uniref:(northern house mosquito) hypothetical protein n=1 Tax=Culex pipiens TaxID=7175 RepID=A0A8D8EYN4_CULPI
MRKVEEILQRYFHFPVKKKEKEVLQRAKNIVTGTGGKDRRTIGELCSWLMAIGRPWSRISFAREKKYALVVFFFLLEHQQERRRIDRITTPAQQSRYHHRVGQLAELGAWSSIFCGTVKLKSHYCTLGPIWEQFSRTVSMEAPCLNASKFRGIGFNCFVGFNGTAYLFI